MPSRQWQTHSPGPELGSAHQGTSGKDRAPPRPVGHGTALRTPYFARDRVEGDDFHEPERSHLRTLGHGRVRNGIISRGVKRASQDGHGHPESLSKSAGAHLPLLVSS